VARVWLVRHAEPSESIGVDPDLTELGVTQAARLVDQLAPCELVTSPLQRARSTARALADAWGIEARVDDTFRELPSPTTSVQERRAWLRIAMQSRFADLGPEVAAWHAAILAAVSAVRTDTVVVTHALVVNAVAGVCLGDDRVLHMRPAHASVTSVDVGDDGVLALVERGPDVESLIG
jgi:broad specificity phosphatase PhoE